MGSRARNDADHLVTSSGRGLRRGSASGRGAILPVVRAGCADRRGRRVLGTLVGLAAQAGVVLVLLTAVAGPASAHAELESTTPSAGVALAVAPARIELRFSEHIRVASGGVRLIDESGSRIDRTDPVVEKGVPDVVALRVPQLHDGAYVVSWRVVSADGHPVRGAFTFRVGSTGNQQAVASLAERLLSGSRVGPTWVPCTR